jgi:hypothetical protein
MRIWGTVVMTLGILFMILFVLAEFGGGHLGFVPFFIAGFLTLLGFRLRKSGRGIVQDKPVTASEHSAPGAAAAVAPVRPVATAAQFSTVELPLTPDVAAVVQAQGWRTHRFLLYVVAGCLVFFVGIGGVIAEMDNTPGEGRTFLLAMGAIGAITALLIYGISWLSTIKPVRRDLRGTVYLRTTGPVQVVAIGAGGTLRLADRSFMMNGRSGMKQLSVLGWGTVDYTQHGHIILGAWDREGRGVFSLPGYGASPGATRA